MLCALCAGAVALAQARAEPTTAQSFAADDGDLVISLALENPPSAEILASLSEGLQCEVRFNARVYEKARGLFSFLGDKLIGERHPVYNARFDELGDDYVITTDGRGVYQFQTATSFLASFFSLDNYATGIPVPAAGDCYALTSIEVNVARLVPPLNMISLVFPVNRSATAWTKTPLRF